MSIARDIHSNEACTKLYSACARGDVSEVVQLLPLLPDEINVILNDGGGDAMVVSLGHRHLDVVKILLDAGYDAHEDEDLLILASRSGVLDDFLALIPTVSPRMFVSLLSDAVSAGDLSTVSCLVSLGADVNIGSPLALACSAGHADIVQALISAKSAINPPVGSDVPLFNAALSGHDATASILLRARADADRVVGGESILMAAASGGSVSLFERLLRLDSHPTAVIRRMSTRVMDRCLWRAARNSHAPMCSFIINHREGGDGVDINMRELGATPLMFALQRGHRREARVLLDAGADRLAAHDDGRPMLSFAAEGGCADLVAALLARDADVNAASNGRTALSFAAHPRVVRQLLNARAETNPAGCGPVLAGACAARELESVRVLLDAGAAGFHGLGRVLMSSVGAENKRSELVAPILTLLLDAGASMQQLFSGLAPLPVIAASADAVAAVSAVELLLSRDLTTLDSTDEAGRSGLAVAAGRGNAPLVSLLLGAGAAVDARDSSGATALMYSLSQPAVVRPSLMTVRAMLQAGADTNARDSAGKSVLFHLYTAYRTHTTPSHTACDHSAAPSRPRRWWRACLHLLLAAGADVCGCDAKGETLLTVAMGHGADEFVELLLEVVSQCRMGKVNRIN